VIAQGEVWWADLGEPIGSEAGFRPVLVVQGDSLNRSRIATAVCVPLTSNLKWGEAPGNVVLKAKSTGLPKDSVANLSQVVALDKTALHRAHRTHQQAAAAARVRRPRHRARALTTIRWAPSNGVAADQPVCRVVASVGRRLCGYAARDHRAGLAAEPSSVRRTTRTPAARRHDAPRSRVVLR
jgi:mRNA interferase MazF